MQNRLGRLLTTSLTIGALASQVAFSETQMQRSDDVPLPPVKVVVNEANAWNIATVGVAVVTLASFAAMFRKLTTLSRAFKQNKLATDTAVSQLQSDVTAVKGDVGALKTGMQSLQEGMALRNGKTLTSPQK